MSRICRFSVPVLTVALAMTTAPFANAAGGVPVIQIGSVSAVGTGCPEGSVAAHVSDDGLAFTTLFDSFVTAVENPARSTIQTKYCDLAFSLSAPAGWSYALLGMDVRGFAQTAKRSAASVTVSYKVRRSFVPVKTKTYLPNFADDILIKTQTPAIVSNWSRCDTTPAAYTVRTQVKTWGYQSTVTIDSIDGELRNGLHIAWRKCSQASSAGYIDGF